MNNNLIDQTEDIRHELVQEINSRQIERQQIEAEHGQVWNTQELGNDFEVLGFMAPFVVARQKSTGKKGSLMFQHNPRYYFSWTEDERP